MRLYIDDNVDYGVEVTRNESQFLFTANPADAYGLIHKHNVTEVYLDMHIPAINTADFAYNLKKAFPKVRIVVNTTIELSEAQQKQLPSYIDGYVVK